MNMNIRWLSNISASSSMTPTSDTLRLQNRICFYRYSGFIELKSTTPKHANSIYVLVRINIKNTIQQLTLYTPRVVCLHKMTAK